MNEQAWLACTAPEKMLQFLSANSANRKFRLFICACCRRYWDRLKDERSRHAVTWSEQFIEGEVDENKRREIIVAAWEVLRPYRWWNRSIEAWWAAYAACDRFMDRDIEWKGGRSRAGQIVRTTMNGHRDCIQVEKPIPPCEPLSVANQDMSHAG